MKAGDKVWAVTTVVSVEPNGVIYGDWDMHDPACVIPDHPALPAVARWLAADPSHLEMLSIVIREEANDAAKWGLEQTEQRWRALLAALTTEETA